MRIGQLDWGTRWRIIGYGLTRGFFISFVYSPISVVLLVVFDLIGRTFAGTLTNEPVNMDTMLAYGIGATLVGSLLGIIIGLVGGVAIVSIFAVASLFRREASLEMYRRPNFLTVTSAIIVGILTLLVTIYIPGLLTPKDLIVGGMIWVAIPTIIASIAGWMVSQRALEATIR